MLKEIIIKISNEFITEAVNSPKLMEDIAAMEKYMAESYIGRIFIELLQNADDALSNKVKLIEYKGNLIFANDGRPFSKDDVISLSRSGSSKKERGETIGYRGIGFKSTTYLSSEILIYSNNTYFTYSKSICAKTLKMNKHKIPTVRIPFLVNDIEKDLQNITEELIKDGFTTLFIFKNANMEQFCTELKSINNGYFLFLRNILNCDVLTQKIKLKLSVIRRKDKVFSFIKFNSNIDSTEWLIYGNNNSQLAFRYDNRKIIHCLEEEAVYHCFLPTFDRSPYLFKINGDFSTDPSRKHISMDKFSTNTLEKIADDLYEFIVSLFSYKKEIDTFADVLAILTNRLSYSYVNTRLIKILKSKLCRNKWIPINSGIKIPPSEYKLLPTWLESTEKAYIRKYSKFVNENSLSNYLYDSLRNIDEFLLQYSAVEYSLSDMIKILEDYEFVDKINNETYAKILTNIMKFGKNNDYISKEPLNIDNLLLKTEIGILQTKNISRDNNLKLIIGVNKVIEQYASDRDIEWFIKKTSIIITKKKEKTLLLESSNKFEKYSVKNSKSVVSKWRSAEKQCVELEKYLGNNAVDVSKRNLGYDIESETKNGEKRYIEVKLLNHRGATFAITNNEFTAAHQYGEEYYICLMIIDEMKLNAIYIKNPIANIEFEKRIKQWEWYCENYIGDEISIEYS